MFRLANFVFIRVNPLPGVNSPAALFSKTASDALTVSITVPSSCENIFVEEKKKIMRLRERNKNENTLEFSDRNKLFITNIPFLISKRMRLPKYPLMQN
jgi:hypothetical protein